MEAREGPGRGRYPYLLVVLIALFGGTLSFLAAYSSHRAAAQEVRREFKAEVDARTVSLERTVSLNFEVLYSLKVLFESSETVTPKEFSLAAESALRRHPDIQALEYIPRVPSERRAALEAGLRRTYPDFLISERSGPNRLVPAARREEYFPVAYVAPLAGNEPALGFDLASEPNRRETLLQARDDGLIRTTGAIVLVQGDEEEKGFLALLPVYAGNPGTEEERRRRLQGFVAGVYTFRDLFTSASLPAEAAGIDMTLLDMSAAEQSRILYYHASRTNSPPIESMSYHRSLSEIAGRRWDVLAVPTREFINSRRRLSAPAIFIVGLAFTGLVTALLLFISRRSAVVEQLVTLRTEELNVAVRKLERLSLTDGLTGVTNRRGLDIFLDREWKRAARNARPISMILLDIDNFKAYNDHYGHPAGDECLKQVAKTLNDNVSRSGDQVARYGGEEFAIMLPETDSGCSTLADRCRAAIEGLQIPHAFSAVAPVVTASLGLATIVPGRESDPEDILEAADRALYMAKGEGRNRVKIARA
jgi:diguanylate cyclase (GGDEF)-like protein